MKSSALRACIAVSLCSIFLCSTGCVSFMANFLRVVKGTDSPAEFADLKDKKVAVIAITDSGMNSDATGIIVSNYVHTLLATNVKKIQLINQEEVGRIINDQASTEQDIVLIGNRLNADYVVAVKIEKLRLHEGQTLYKGKCTASISAYNVAEGGSPVFRKSIPDFAYPQTGVPITDIDESTFQQFYLAEISNRLARAFYPYDPSVDVAKDAAVASIPSLR